METIMKKILLIVIFYLSIFLFWGCKRIDEKPNEVSNPDKSQVDPNDDATPIDDQKEIDLPNELLSLSIDEVVSMTGFHSLLSSTIFQSSNNDLVYYVLRCLIDIKHFEENDILAYNEDDYIDTPSITINLTNNRLIKAFSININDCHKVMLNYYEDGKLKYSFNAINQDTYSLFKNFCVMGYPENEWWCETPVVTTYINDPAFSKYNQEYVIKSFIRTFSPLSDHYINGTMFSGYICDYFGCFNNYYAVIVNGCGLEYLEEESIEEIDGIKFRYSNSNRIYLIGHNILTLQEAYNQKILTKKDLKEIARLLNKELISFDLKSKVEAILRIEAFLGTNRSSSTFINSLSYEDSIDLFNTYFKNIAVTNDKNIIDSIKNNLSDVRCTLIIDTMYHQFTISVLDDGRILFYYYNNKRKYEFISTGNPINLEDFGNAIKSYETDNSLNSYALNYSEFAQNYTKCSDFTNFYKAKNDEELQLICTKLNIRKDVSFSSDFYKDHGIILFALQDNSEYRHYFKFRVNGDTLNSNYQTQEDSKVNNSYYYVFVEVSIDELNSIKKIEIKDNAMYCANDIE